jgi:hypothetical protein
MMQSGRNSWRVGWTKRRGTTRRRRVELTKKEQDDTQKEADEDKSMEDWNGRQERCSNDCKLVIVPATATLPSLYCSC